MTNDPQTLEKPIHSDFPEAIPVSTSDRRRERAWQLWGWWSLAMICIAFAVGLLVWQRATRGPEIVVRFRQGHGIKVENRLLHRGIEMGSVEKIAPTLDLQFVDVTLRLVPSAESLMREGSLFWIERPSLNLQGARGLDTILSGRYVAVEPGPPTGPVRRSFRGLEEPLPNRFDAEALEIVLEGTELHGLQADAPVIYRGLNVGRVQNVGLSADGRWITARAAVNAHHRNLVRTNSRFWNRSGFRIDVGLTGIALDAESLAGIAAGGIEFATPDPPGEIVKAGQRFELAAKAESEWKTWQPRLLHGKPALEGFGRLPVQARVTATWKQEVLLGFSKTGSNRGWILLVDDGSIIGPSDLFTIPPTATAGSMRWECGGEELDPSRRTDFNRTASEASEPGLHDESDRYCIRTVLDPAPINGTRWPASRIAEWKPQPQPASSNASGERPVYPLWIVGEVPSEWLPIEWHQIDVAAGAPWKLDASIGLTADRHGAAVLDGLTGNVVGILDVRKLDARVLPIQTR